MQKYLQLYEQCKGFYVREEGGAAPSSADAPVVTVTDTDGVGTSLEDLLFAESVRMFELAFEEQFHYGEFD